mmetsp:Transcript_6552/g.20475  ORF Transcript_6552/g.20475 Transcript_6552/m.20475 type:complete len:248 (-) Transcript_6552:47-790(-)
MYATSAMITSSSFPGLMSTSSVISTSVSPVSIGTRKAPSVDDVGFKTPSLFFGESVEPKYPDSSVAVVLVSPNISTSWACFDVSSKLPSLGAPPTREHQNKRPRTARPATPPAEKKFNRKNELVLRPFLSEKLSSWEIVCRARDEPTGEAPTAPSTSTRSACRSQSGVAATVNVAGSTGILFLAVRMIGVAGKDATCGVWKLGSKGVSATPKPKDGRGVFGLLELEFDVVFNGSWSVANSISSGGAS